MQDTLMLWMHAKYGIRIPTQRTKNCMAGNNDKLFDAYFSYCLKDDQVVTQIASELEGYRLCLHQQNILGNNRNPAEAALSAAKASARTVIVISKAFLASEWDGIKTFLLGPESGDISRNVIIILLQDMFDYENIQNFEVKTFINSSQNILHWHESKFWAKLRYLLPDPISTSSSLDKTNITQLDSTELWNLTPKTISKSRTKQEMPDSGVSSAHMSQLSLSQTNNGGTTRSESLRYKTKSRQSLPSTVGSNNEFIYLTPKPKKAHCQPLGHDDQSGYHQRSSSEVYQQHQSQYGPNNYHQRSKSTLAPSTAAVYYDNHQNLQGSMIPPPPRQPASNIYNQIIEPEPDASNGPQIYGSTSFIYKLINDTPTLPMYTPGHHQTSQSQQMLHQRSRSGASSQSSQQSRPQPHHASQYQLPSYHNPSQLSGSSSQLAGGQHQQVYGGGDLRSNTLAYHHRRDLSHPSYHHQQHHQQQPLPPQHPNSTLNILQDILHNSPSGSTIHQRSKSSPYNGFVV